MSEPYILYPAIFVFSMLLIGFQKAIRSRFERQRNAVARRKLQDLHDEKVLQFCLAEVWD